MQRRPAARSQFAPAIRLQSPGQIAAAVPYLVGFRPEESVVAVGVASNPPRVCLTVRVDLPPPDCSGRLADMLCAHLEHAGAVRMVPVVYTAEPGERPRKALIDALEEAARRRGIELLDALLVRADHWRSYRCQAVDCCPPGGTLVDAADASELAAAAAYLGDVVHASREDLGRALEPVEQTRRVRLGKAFAAQRRLLATELSAHGRPAAAAASRDLLREAVAARAETTAELSDPEVARLALGLTDVTVRDSALCWAGTDLEHAAEALWIELIRKAPTPYDAPPATLLAAHAYLRGNGAYARIALERALASDPTYSFAQLLTEGLDRAVPPKALRAALRLTQPDVPGAAGHDRTRFSRRASPRGD